MSDGKKAHEGHPCEWGPGRLASCSPEEVLDPFSVRTVATELSVLE